MEQNGFTLGSPIPTEEVGYARVSDKDDQSPDMQVALLKKRGIPEANIFVDEMSGRLMDRPQLKRALMLMEGRPGWTLVVYKLDRLGRDALGLMKLGRQFQDKGWNLVSLTEQIDTRTPMGAAFFAIMAVMAQLESDLISERTRAGVARRREQGLPVGAPPKFTLEEMQAIQTALETETWRKLGDIAKEHGCSVGYLQSHWPGWRSKSPDERARHRALYPLIGK